MPQLCSKCSRANPPEAVYCYNDGFVLAGNDPVLFVKQTGTNPGRIAGLAVLSTNGAGREASTRAVRQSSLGSGDQVISATSILTGKRVGANPWDAPTLEWATTSPPPEYNFAEIPVVGHRDPLWAEKYGTEDHGDDTAEVDVDHLAVHQRVDGGR